MPGADGAAGTVRDVVDSVEAAGARGCAVPVRPVSAGVPVRGFPSKAERKRAARAELLLKLAVAAESWAQQLRGEGVRPFGEWPADDPLKRLVLDWALSPEDVARLADELAGRLEAQAIRAGYGDLDPVR